MLSIFEMRTVLETQGYVVIVTVTRSVNPKHTTSIDNAWLSPVHEYRPSKPQPQ